MRISEGPGSTVLDMQYDSNKINTTARATPSLSIVWVITFTTRTVLLPSVLGKFWCYRRLPVKHNQANIPHDLVQSVAVQDLGQRDAAGLSARNLCRIQTPLAQDALNPQTVRAQMPHLAQACALALPTAALASTTRCGLSAIPRSRAIGLIPRPSDAP